jgi:hypothetical protein
LQRRAATGAAEFVAGAAGTLYLTKGLGITGVAHSVSIGVELVWVGNVGAIVIRVRHAVGVIVEWDVIGGVVGVPLPFVDASVPVGVLLTV